MHLIIGFALFGLLLGFIVGISSAAITQPLIAALFAFIGGKLFIDIEKKTDSVKKVVGLVLAFFSSFCLMGVVAGVFIKINQTFGTQLEKNEEGSVQAAPYLKSSPEFITNTLQQYRQSGSTNCDSILDVIENEYKK